MGTKTDRKRLRAATYSDSGSEDERVPRVFDKFFIVASSEQDKTFSKLSPFVIEKTLFSTIGNTNNVKILKDGKLLVEICREKQGINLQKLESFCGIKCTISPHKTLNSSKGIIRDRRLFCCSEEEIKENLASQGVTHVKRITIRRDKEQVKTNTLILTFNNPKRPDKLKIFFQLISVSPYIPNPLRCYWCQKFGHHENNCRNPPKCGHCADARNHGECGNPVKCANCDGPHPAYSNKCPVWQKEKEVTRVKFTNNVSYPEARKIVENIPVQTYSTIVKSSSKVMRDASTQTCDASTQTPESIPANTVPAVAAGKPSASADKLSAPAGNQSAAASGAAKTGTPVPNGKNTSKSSGRPSGQQTVSAAKGGRARSPKKKDPKHDPIRTGNKFDVLKDGATEEMDCQSSPSVQEANQKSHSPIRPPK